MDWVIDFGKGCGPLRFGMSTAEVSSIIGLPNESRIRDDVEFIGDDKWRDCKILYETRNESGWRECEYLDGRLKSLSVNARLLPNLFVDGIDLLSLPIMSAFEVFDKANGGTGQAQGGSLYFEKIAVAILQIDMPSIREVVLFETDYDHGEPLRPVSLDEVKTYYIEQVGQLPDNDRLKSTDNL